MGNTLFFSNYGSIAGSALWKSDGTPAGTVLVKDIYPDGIYDSNLEYLTAVGSTLFFTASEGPNNDRLWKSDGTAAGTVLVKHQGTTGHAT